MLVELIDLLGAGSLEPEERAEAIAQVERAPQELDWAGSPEKAYAIALCGCLNRHCASGDHLADMFEGLHDLLGDDLPPVPGGLKTMLEHYTWLDRELEAWNDTGGYDLVDVDDTVGDEMHHFVVHRRDTPRILEIGRTMKLKITRPLAYWQQIDTLSQQ